MLLEQPKPLGGFELGNWTFRPKAGWVHGFMVSVTNGLSRNPGSLDQTLFFPPQVFSYPVLVSLCSLQPQLFLADGNGTQCSPLLLQPIRLKVQCAVHSKILLCRVLI